MKHVQYEFKEHFLEEVLISYFDNNDSLRIVVNCNAIEPAVKDFMNHFYSYDLKHKTNHTTIIEQMFITKELNRDTCDKLGYCKRTFYRYRKYYLQIFNMYLLKKTELKTPPTYDI